MKWDAREVERLYLCVTVSNSRNLVGKNLSQQIMFCLPGERELDRTTARVYSQNRVKCT